METLSSQGPSMTPDTTPSLWRSDGRLPRILFAVAVLLFIAGLLAGFFPATAELAVTLRWVGLGLCIPLVARRRSLLAWTFFSMLAGAELGVDAPQFAAQTHFLADIFLRLIRMIVAPLIFGGIVTGIAGHGKLGGVGRVALKSIVVFEGATTLGLILGALAINFSQAGVGVTLPATIQAAVPAAHQAGWQEILLNIFPENIAQAVAQNQILQVAIFALLFGTAMATLPEPKRAPLLAVLQSLTETMFRLTGILMYMAPVAAGAALAYTVGSMGLLTLLPLAKLAVTCYVTLIAFALLVLAPILLLTRIPLRRFAAGHGTHGRVRRPALDCLLRHPHRLQLQHDRLQHLRLHGGPLRRSGRGHPSFPSSANRSARHPGADQQGDCRRSPRHADRPVGRRRFFPHPRRRRPDAARSRHPDGYGPHRHERHRQLHGRRLGRPVGRGTEGCARG
jgi:hypothetical protein